MTYDLTKDEQAVVDGVRAMLRIAGENPERNGLIDTPGRFLKAWQEMTARPGDPAVLLTTLFDDAGPSDEMVVVGPLAFTSLCEHHLMPFTGHAWIAYLPTTDRVIGLSKLPRLLHHYAQRPQVQERLTKQITDAIDTHVETLGAACVIKATHTCASMRGVKTEAPMTTSSLTGAFREPEVRAEFLGLTR